MSTEIREPITEVSRLAQRLGELQKTVKAVQKLLKDLSSAKVLADDRKLTRSLEQLKKLEAGPPELSQEWREVAEGLERWQQHRKKTLPLTFGRELKEAATGAGVEFSTLTADPPAYRLAPFTVEARFGKGRAFLSYARLPVGEAELDVAAILIARERYLRALEGDDFEPETYFDRLLEAYRRVVAGSGARPGGRVELVELLPELAFLFQSTRFRSDPVRENYRPYGKVRLAYDLGRLKRAGCLAREDTRLALGTATIGTTRRKDRVLYLEDSSGRGQYYLTIGFHKA